MDAQYKADLEQVLRQLQPQSVLCLGAPCTRAVLDYVAAAPDRLSRHYTEPPDDLGHFDLVVVEDLLERLDKRHGEQLLARLRDLHGGRFLLTLSSGPRSQQVSRWERNELLALGLVMAGRYADADGERQLYRFNLDDYKTTPEWFTARYWAHPERWDKEFW
jgi:hypothetical protein